MTQLPLRLVFQYQISQEDTKEVLSKQVKNIVTHIFHFIGHGGGNTIERPEEQEIEIKFVTVFS
jgi:hypothetical protein